MTHEITPNAFKIFIKKVKKCKELLGLQDINFVVTAENIEKENANACCDRDYSMGRVDIWIEEAGIESRFNNLEKDLAYIAFHEVVECGLLGELTCIAERNSNDTEKEDIERASHAIVHRLWEILQDKI